ncbi:DUF3891 family protein [Spirosoma validum]|uniref:DUF3891 family protein n=1 Tax=Spirosoma validum TaxID=2771355 RepID=A0A927B154_9BACT|nr:DUF3891 family protein [Spirosoma validum]MBD2753342.1 DUF3891 family protein [Spirosoma validum]
MIVTQTDEGWQIINQQAHGLLAVQLASHWGTDKRPIHWIETLIALTEHDDGQEPWTGRNHLTKAGGPLHFQILQYSIEQCRNLIQIGLQKSRWNALIMSMHTSFLYESKRGTDKELDLFMDQQIHNQTSWRKQYKATKAEANYAYSFVQWCDALSLILCMGQIPPEERRLEVSKGPDGISYYIQQRNDDTLTIEPWPFDSSTFSVHVEAFQLPQLAFQDDHELYNVMQEAPIIMKEWVFRKQ